MPLRKNAGTLKIKEQIIHLEGLTLLFRVGAQANARYRLSILGSCLPYGNYEVIFDEEGAEAWCGTQLPYPDRIRKAS